MQTQRYPSAALSPPTFRSPSISSHTAPTPNIVKQAPALFPLVTSLVDSREFQETLARHPSLAGGKSHRSSSNKPHARSKTRSSKEQRRATNGGGMEQWVKVPRQVDSEKSESTIDGWGEGASTWHSVASTARTDVAREGGPSSEAAAVKGSSTWPSWQRPPSIHKMARQESRRAQAQLFSPNIFNVDHGDARTRPPLPPLPPLPRAPSLELQRPTKRSHDPHPLPIRPSPLAQGSRSLPDLSTSLLPSPQSAIITSAYPVHSPSAITPDRRTFSTSHLSPSGLTSPARPGSSFSHAVSQLKRMLSRASNVPRSTTIDSRDASSSFSRSRSGSKMSDYPATLVSPSPLDNFTSLTQQYSAKPTKDQTPSPPLRPTSQTIPLRPISMFIPRDELSTYDSESQTLEREAHKKLLALLREGPGAPLTTPAPDRPQTPTSRILAQSQPPPIPTSRTSTIPLEDTRLNSIDEASYWTYANSRATTLPRETTPTWRSGTTMSNYSAYGSRWEEGDDEDSLMREGKEKRAVLAIWKKWVKEKVRERRAMREEGRR